MSLNLYIRNVLALPGTKAMCREGGCGVCIVTVKARRPTSGLVETFSVNSCLVLVFSCHGWDITTIEGLGDRCRGYDVIQKRFKDFNATQCGYCTPGWVMHMHSLQDKHLTQAVLEQSFGSNTCRCTGFRPILDAVKSFAVDASPELLQKVKDIEDFDACCGKNGKCKQKRSSECGKDWSLVAATTDSNTTIELDFGANKFFKVFGEDEIFEVLEKHGAESYMFADGNTGKGIYETFNYPRVIIDISDVKSLKEHQVDQNLILGANTALEDCIDIFESLAGQMEEFEYLKEFAKHFRLIAHIPVRKIGSLAGNLMLKHEMPFYQSDVFLLLSCVGAVVNVRDASGQVHTLTMPDFQKFDMSSMLMQSVVLPPMAKSVIFKSYKIMPRNQNALAIVNAAFLLQLGDHHAVQRACLTFGNIAEHFVCADNTANYLLGKSAFSNETLRGAIKELCAEVQPTEFPPEPSPECRQKLAVGLFYKFMLSIAPPELVSPRYRSGGAGLTRPVSRGTQDFQTFKELYPLNKPVPKLEAMIQSSGEAEYTNDIPPIPGEVFAAFVQATVHSGQVDYVDTTGVLKIPGVLAVLTAKDIPGKNSFTRPGLQLISADEEILVSVQVLYYGQPVAVVVAEREDLAAEVAQKVCVTYKNVPDSKPVLTIEDAMKDNNRYFISDNTIEPTSRGTNIQKVIKGKYAIGYQYHYYMEPITCVVRPVDAGLEVHESTQWMDATQVAVAQCLAIKESDVTLKVRRCGGAFGGKISRQAHAACGAALAAAALGRAARMVLPLRANTTVPGARPPNLCHYEVGVDNDGKIQYLEAQITEDEGCSHNESVLSYIVDGFRHCYDAQYWHLTTAYVFTDTPSNTFARAPGTSEGITHIEHIMEHIAFEVNKDPTEVRKINMRTDDNDLPEMIDTLKKDAEYDRRVQEIEKFNLENRWMKRDIQISVMLFPVIYYGNYTAMVSIYRGDGTVTVTGGGVEMGQGLNTKTAQVCAYELGIPLDNVSVLPHFSYISANNVFSGSSITSESVCYSVIRACKILKDRLEPVRQTMTQPYTWKELVWKASEQLIDLTAKYMMTDQEPDLQAYSAFAVAMLETQLDVVAGRYEKLRADVLEDVGLSANPLLDVGQLEGGYIQGLGYYTSEQLVRDQHSGKLLTDRSLSYHVPLALDIPADLRVKFRYNSKNPKGVLGSKTVGEMGICTAHGITHVLRHSIQRSRTESGYDPTEWIDIDTPYTTESILKALDVKYEEFLYLP